MKITQLFLLQASDFVLCSQDAFSHTIWYFLREGGLILLKCSPATMTLCYQDFFFHLIVRKRSVCVHHGGHCCKFQHSNFLQSSGCVCRTGRGPLGRTMRGMTAELRSGVRMSDDFCLVFGSPR